jgi:hypothetical protein
MCGSPGEEVSKLVMCIVSLYLGIKRCDTAKLGMKACSRVGSWCTFLLPCTLAPYTAQGLGIGGNEFSGTLDPLRGHVQLQGLSLAGNQVWEY